MRPDRHAPPAQRRRRAQDAALDVLVISSRNEGVLIAALEAMAAGVPLVVTAVGGLVDLIRDAENGWLTPLDDPDRLAEVLHHALVLPAERSGVAEAARLDVQARYRADAIHLELEQLYRDALTRAGARNPAS